MIHSFGKSLVLVVAAVLLSAATLANAQVRTNQIQIAPTPPGGTGPIISSGVGSPDLIVAPPYLIPCIDDIRNCRAPRMTHLPESGYCGPWNGGNQKVRLNVINIGTAQSGLTQVNIEYLYSGAGLTAAAVVPSLQPGETFLVEFSVPAGAWAPGGHSSYHYRLIVDIPGSVSESNEGNNVETSHCLGPAS